MKTRSHGRSIAIIVGVFTFVITVSALFSLAQPGLPVSSLALPDLPALPKVPHLACPTCFTYICPDCYTIFEEIPGTGITLPRQIPNPAPLELGETRAAFDVETGLPIWYIGRQGFVGPTDEEPFSMTFPMSLIAQKRIVSRHEGEIFSIPGVHGFGIGRKGLVVHLDPQYLASEDLIPQEIEGVPVAVEVQERAKPLGSHITEKLRPVSIGAAIEGSRGNGTAGPPIVRTVGGTRILTLTAAHVVKFLDEDTFPLSVLQPPNGPQWGVVSHAFRLIPCDTPADLTCTSANAPVNDTWERPDIAAIAHSTPHFDTSPHRALTDPEDTRNGTIPSESPIRWLLSDFNPNPDLGKRKEIYINGPSGIIGSPGYGASARLWGAFSCCPTPSGSIRELVVKVSASDSQFGGVRQFKQRYLCGIDLEKVPLGGDSGALVSGTGTGSRHVFGVLVGGTGSKGFFVPAGDIKTAFTNSNFAFSHFWGTASGYRPPSDQQCDGGC